jgi:tetratricopeptide (TPR) repeat protein
MADHTHAGSARPDLVAAGVAPMTPPDALAGRRFELTALAEHVRSPDVRMVTVTGAAGVGKTALVCHLLRHWPGPGRAPAVVHLGPPSEFPVGYPRLFRGLCRLLPPADARRLAGRHRVPQETPTAMIDAVLDALPAGPVVVLLDGVEGLADGFSVPPDPTLEEALRALVSDPAHEVTIVVTSRVPPGALLAYEPAAQRRIELAALTGAAVSELLRAHDPDGALGLRDLEPAERRRVTELTDGNPRAIEALAATLAVDKTIVLPELLDRIVHDPTTLVETAFEHLEPFDQQVVAALAAIPVPVRAAGVDHVLHPFHADADSAPVLRRLAEHGLVRCVDDRYSLPAAEAELALAPIRVGHPSDRTIRPLPFTRNALWHRAADLLAGEATPAEHWTSIDDLTPQLAEFELRWSIGEIDDASDVLARGVVAALRSWGHHRLTSVLLDRVRGRSNDPARNAWCAAELGLAHAELGQPNRAIEMLERARQLHLAGDPTVLGRLGRCHADLGDLERAVEQHRAAVAARRAGGDRGNLVGHLVDLAWSHTELGRPAEAVTALAEAMSLADAPTKITTLVHLGRAHAADGALGRAIELHERGVDLASAAGDERAEIRHLVRLGAARLDAAHLAKAVELQLRALDLARAVGDRIGEAAAMLELARCEILLDQPRQAVELGEQAFPIAEDAGHLRLRAAVLHRLGHSHLALRESAKAWERFSAALEVADATGCRLVQSGARVGLAHAFLQLDDLGGADKMVRAAGRHPHPATRPEVALLTAAVRFRQGEPEMAGQRFRDALTDTVDRMRSSPETVEAALLDLRALARVGLWLTDNGDRGAAESDFRAARRHSSAPGAAARALRWLDILTPVDRPDALDELRLIARG